MAIIPETPGDDPTFVLANLAVVQGLLTQDQLRDAVAEHARSLSSRTKELRPLRAILIEKQYLTPEQLDSLAERNSSDLGMGRARPPASLGKYQIVRELGRGGMGVVYEAIDSHLKRRVALKMMLGNPNADPEEAKLDEERFLREAQLSAKLEKHPHIVSVYEADVIEGKRYLAMEFIEGQPMSKWRKAGSVTIRQQIVLLRDVALAVHHAHNQNVVHRDLKPENILVDGRSQPHVTDFGLAKSVGQNVSLSLTASGMVMGTPTHMSPEQAQGLKSLDHRTDIYSLGVMLYETLTGRLPFQGETAIEILMKAVRSPVPPPSTVVKAGTNPTLDKAIENICLKALAKKPRDRYSGGDAFAADLTRWLKGEEVKVASPITRRKVYEKTRSTWTYGVSAAILLCLVLVGVWLAGSRGDPAFTERALREKEAQEVQAALDRGDRLLREKKHAEALGAFEGVLSRDPLNLRAVSGKREAQRLLDEKIRIERDAATEKAKKDFDEKTAAADRARKEADEKAQAERDATLESERQRFAEERRVFEEKAKSAEEARRKAEEQLRDAQQTSPRASVAATLPPEDAWANAVNLLPLIDPSDGKSVGTWKLEDGRIVSDGTHMARIQAAYEPPEEYDFRIVFTRLESNHDVAQILTKNGRTFFWTMGCDSNRAFGFGLINGQWAHVNPTSVRVSSCLENGRIYTSIVQIRKGGVKAHLDGKTIAQWSTDYTDMGPLAQWQPREDNLLGIASGNNTTAFHRVDVLEVTGKGRITRAPVKPVIPKPASPGSGLIGHWRFDEIGGAKALDSSGKGLDGTLMGEPTRTSGRIGGALSFAGGNQYVNTPIQEYKAVTTTFTMSAWVKPSRESGPGQEKFAIYPTQGGAAYGPGHAGTGLTVGTNGIGVWEHTDFHIAPSITYDAPISGWIHVALVCQKMQPSLYVDGRLVKVGPVSPRILHPSPGIGGDSLATRSFVGCIDDVRIYDRALSAAEVVALAKVAVHPIPDSKKVAEAERAIKELFKADYAKRSPADMQLLAKKLLDKGSQTTEDLALYFVCLREARDLSAQAGDSMTALAAIQRISESFSADMFDMSATAFSTAAKVVKTPDAAGKLAEAYLAVAEKAITIDSYDSAAALMSKMESTAKASQNTALLVRAQARRREVEDMKREYARIQPSVKALESKPDDPDANHLVGRFQCFFKRDWKSGLEYLLKGSDAKLKLLAEKELARPSDGLSQISIADGYWDFVERHQGILKTTGREHAVEWYQRAWGQVSGDIREKLRGRFKSAYSRPPNQAPKVPANSVIPGWGIEAKSLDDAFALSGLFSLRISKPATLDQLDLSSRRLPVRPGEQFVLSGWIMTEHTAVTDQFVLQFFFEDGVYLLGATGPGVPADEPFWSFRSKIVTCPPGITSMSVYLVIRSKGTIWLDDVSLKRVGEDKELVENGSFEQVRSESK